jgi:hypothetical protein
MEELFNFIDECSKGKNEKKYVERNDYIGFDTSYIDFLSNNEILIYCNIDFGSRIFHRFLIKPEFSIIDNKIYCNLLTKNIKYCIFSSDYKYVFEIPSDIKIENSSLRISRVLDLRILEFIDKYY